ncbi:MAG: hypothetical protein KGQ57_07905 [Burkholderiales bacterium]|nr:hypothetical protein [Burkholderiales bacterium]
MHIIRFLTTAAGTLLMATAVASHSKQLDYSVTKDRLIVHFGILPAERARAVEGAASAPEQAAAPGRASHHLVVALRDKLTGNRIEGATVTAKMTSPGPKPRPEVQTKLLQELKAKDSTSYGNYFDMPWRGRYRIDLSVRRKQAKQTEKVRLIYDQRF